MKPYYSYRYSVAHVVWFNQILDAVLLRPLHQLPYSYFTMTPMFLLTIIYGVSRQQLAVPCINPPFILKKAEPEKESD